MLRALSGGYDLETRLKIVQALIGAVDVSLNGLLKHHLERMRVEAEASGKKDLAKEAERLLRSLERSED